MEGKYAVAERERGRRRPGYGRAWLSRSALVAAISFSPSAGICGQQNTIRTSLQATLTVVSETGSLSVARLAGVAATGPSTIFAVRPWCTPSCIVFMDHDPGVTGSQRNLRGSRESTPERLVITPDSDSAPLALRAGSNRNPATVLIYF